jgi:predicted nucleic acid-binding protein
MILIDTNILSTFAKIDKLDLLFTLFEGQELTISSNGLSVANYFARFFVGGKDNDQRTS